GGLDQAAVTARPDPPASHTLWRGGTGSGVRGRREGAMGSVGQAYTSGNWTVREGSEDEFIERWTAFVRWAAENASGARSFVLIRDARDARHFISLGA